MYRRMTMMKQTIAVLLAVFCLTLCLAALAEAPQVFTAAPEVQQMTGLGENTNTAAEGYIRKAFGLPDLAPVSRAPKRGTLLDLDSPEKRLYDALEKKIQLVAKGQLESTVLEVPMGELFKQLGYSSEELGLSAFNNDNMQVFWDQFAVDAVSVVNALLVDYPYELFWYDKTAGYSYGIYGNGASGTTAYLSLTDDTVYRVSMSVAQEYAVSRTQKTTSFDTNFVTATQQAKTTAEAMVADNRALSDYDKLTAYRDGIRALTDYNWDAAQNNATPYGNPWQVIWVFDGDPSTTVVCEGYAKAFQWLCDMSSFQTNITVNLATGNMQEVGEAQGEGHMWNIVTMGNGKNYMVDVTNYHLGANMFMGTYEAMVSYYGEGDPAGYRFLSDNNNRKFVYTYDSGTANAFTGAERTLAEKSFDQEPDAAALIAPHIVTWTMTPENPMVGEAINIALDKAYDMVSYIIYRNGTEYNLGLPTDIPGADSVGFTGLRAGQYEIIVTCADDGETAQSVTVPFTVDVEADALAVFGANSYRMGTVYLEYQRGANYDAVTYTLQGSYDETVRTGSIDSSYPGGMLTLELPTVDYWVLTLKGLTNGQEMASSTLYFETRLPVTVTAMESTVAYGGVARFTYQVTGPMYGYTALCYVAHQYTAGDVYGGNVDYAYELTEDAESLNMSVDAYGHEIIAKIGFMNPEGTMRSSGVETDCVVQVTGDPFTYVSQVTVNGTQAATYVPTFLAGDELRFDYHIDDSYGVTERSLYLRGRGGRETFPLSGGAEGTLVLSPEQYQTFTDTGDVNVYARFTDNMGLGSNVWQTSFQIVSCDLRLPENLTTIEAEAFAGITNKSVYIPENVTAIEDGVFDESMTIMCKRGSWAEQWAVAKGLQPTLID